MIYQIDLHFSEKHDRNLPRASRSPFSLDVFITPNAALKARNSPLYADKLLLKQRTLSRRILAISGVGGIQQTKAHLGNGTVRGRGNVEAGERREPSHC